MHHDAHLQPRCNLDIFNGPLYQASAASLSSATLTTLQDHMSDLQSLATFRTLEPFRKVFILRQYLASRCERGTSSLVSLRLFPPRIGHVKAMMTKRCLLDRIYRGPQTFSPGLTAIATCCWACILRLDDM
jgi:hypothetical protein